MKIHPHKQAQPVQSSQSTPLQARLLHCKSRRTIKNHQQQRPLSSARPTQPFVRIVRARALFTSLLSANCSSTWDLGVICILFFCIFNLPVAGHVQHLCVCIYEYICTCVQSWTSDLSKMQKYLNIDTTRQIAAFVSKQRLDKYRQGHLSLTTSVSSLSVFSLHTKYAIRV